MISDYQEEAEIEVYCSCDVSPPHQCELHQEEYCPSCGRNLYEEFKEECDPNCGGC